MMTDVAEDLDYATDLFREPTPPDGAAADAPPVRPPEPPADEAKAPYGWTYTAGQWRPKKRAGRPKGEPRIETAPPAATPPPKAAAAKPAIAKPRKDYIATITGALEGLWFLGACTPIKNEEYRIRTRVQAAILEQNVGALTQGINNMAQNVDFIGSALDRMEQGKGGLWVLPTILMLAPFLAQTGRAWSEPIDETAATIAAHVEAQAAEHLQRMSAMATPADTAA